jgi:hypothetical protein
VQNNRSKRQTASALTALSIRNSPRPLAAHAMWVRRD